MNIADAPWAKFMEDTLYHMVESDVEKVMMVCIDKDGTVATAFTENTTINDLALGGFWLTQEARENAIACHREEDDEEESQ